MNELRIAGLGCSAGGLKPLYAFFSKLSPNSATAFVVICHFPRTGHNTMLHEILSRITRMPVHLLSRNVVAKRNNVYVLPGDLCVKITEGILCLRKRTPSEIINKSIDEFLLSLAIDQGVSGIAVIFSGSGDDGAEGVKSVSDNGGVVLVQHPVTAQFTSMPAAAIEADSPDEVLSPEDLGEFFTDIILSGKHAG